MIKNNTFIFNLEWYAVLSEYPAEIRLEVYEAIIGYALSGTLPDLKPLAKMAFSFIRKEMDYNRERYRNTVERNRENGRKGGAPKGNRNAAKRTSKTTQNNPPVEKTTLTTLNDNDNVNDNELSSTTDTHARAGAVVADGDFLKRFFSDSEAVEDFCRASGVSVTDLRRLAEETVTEWRLTARTHETEQDARRHLISHIRIKLRSDVTDPQDRYARRRGADSATLCPEDYNGEI